MTTQEPFTLIMSDGAEVVGRRVGNPHGVRLLITHGNGFAIDGYRVFFEPLLADFDVFLYDMRNHGKSPVGRRSAHHYQRLALDVGEIRAEIVRRYGHKTTVGVFHSFSSRAAMKHAVEQGWVWDALVLFDPPSVPPEGHTLFEPMRQFEVKLVQWAMERQETYASVDDLIASFREGRAQARWVDEARVDMANATLRPDGKGGFATVLPRELEAAIYLQALTLDLWPMASEFRGPTKLIAADPDMKGTPPTAFSNRALGTENGFDYAAVPGGGHLLQIEQPEASRAIMLAFLKEQGIIG
ncbi:alpha/beta fold hydrolase [Xanthobacter tagetidis]|uniref:Alpha/beta hydrolase n=1 Tax=Xanthobacter tagetidis TaxID=60216 RepID=A0A3L7A9G0_9HYPH|nr:alpha/beta hydrolase [Xanthobacter tagetidis]MBB6308342.1 pimeloyl-ACP methyl ester carboxylesterase [Xanthobacter tagetidis]RLP76211.1 alpha/beta hydrolase [Xanthobacter tagetidis]